ncbi:MAG TPA: hypothetical protein VGC67_17790 [Cellulomonas sp.]
MTGLTTLTALTLGGAGTAQAALGRVEPGIEVAGVTGYGTVWLGAVLGTAEAQASGWLSWCVTAGYASPAGAPATAVGTVHDPELAWAVQAHEHDGSALSRAALSYLAHVRHETGTAAVPAAERVAAFESATPQAVQDTAAAFLAEAAAQAGPYRAEQGGTQYTQARRTGAVTVHPLVSANGTALTGRPVRVTLDGPAVFDADGDGTADPGEGRTWSGTSTADDRRLAWVATGTGTVTWSYAYSGLPRQTLTRLSAAGQVQDSLTYGLRAPTDPEEITTPGTPFEVVPDFQPVATSDVAGAKVVEAGTALGDTLTVAAAAGEEWIVLDGDPVDVLLEGTAYATGSVPAPERATVPTGAPVVATATVLADGPGRYAVTAPGPGTGQVVTWVWQVVKEHQPGASRDLVRGDWSDSYGLAAETTSVRHDSVTVDSSLSVRETRSGTYLLDDLWVTGFPADHPTFAGGAGLGPDTATMAQELWFFPAEVPVTDADLGSAELVSSVPVPAGNGLVPSVGSSELRVRTAADGSRVPGTYVFRTVFAGDDRVAPFTSTVQDSTEQLVVASAPLAVTTRARSDRDLVEGDRATLWDVATVTGTVPPGATLEFDLYRWDGAEPVCTAQTLVEQVGTTPDPGTPTGTGSTSGATGTSTRSGPGTSTPTPGPDGLGAGDHRSAETTLDAVLAGTYGYVETVRGAEGQVLARGRCGAADETLDVHPAAPPAAPSAPPTPTPAPTTPVAAPAVSPAPTASPTPAAAAPDDHPLAVTGTRVTALGLAASALLLLGAALSAVRRRGGHGTQADG